MCVCLWLQVRLVINEKGLVCEERDVSLPLQEHKEPWFMRLNLGEEVPVFLHGDTIISDYNQIIDYVEKNFVGGMVYTQLDCDYDDGVFLLKCLTTTSTNMVWEIV